MNVRYGVGVLIPNHNKLSTIVMHRKGSHGEGTWGLPGGWIEEKETVMETAIRESKEEFGIEVIPTHVLTCTSDIHPEGFETVTCFLMVKPVDSDIALTIMEPNKCDYIMWASLCNIHTLKLFTPLKNLVDNYPSHR